MITRLAEEWHRPCEEHRDLVSAIFNPDTQINTTKKRKTHEEKSPERFGVDKKERETVSHDPADIFENMESITRELLNLIRRGNWNAEQREMVMAIYSLEEASALRKAYKDKPDEELLDAI